MLQIDNIMQRSVNISRVMIASKQMRHPHSIIDENSIPFPQCLVVSKVIGVTLDICANFNISTSKLPAVITVKNKEIMEYYDIEIFLQKDMGKSITRHIYDESLRLNSSHSLISSFKIKPDNNTTCDYDIAEYDDDNSTNIKYKSVKTNDGNNDNNNNNNNNEYDSLKNKKSCTPKNSKCIIS
jgi:hypothetical protein